MAMLHLLMPLKFGTQVANIISFEIILPKKTTYSAKLSIKKESNFDDSLDDNTGCKKTTNFKM